MIAARLSVARRAAYASLAAYTHATIDEPTTDVQVLVCDHGVGDIVVAFAGTASVADWLTNLRIGKVPLETAVVPVPGRVHAGYARALASAWDALLPTMERAESRDRHIILTGHSAGGALAVLAAAHLSPDSDVEVWTFGAPPVGDRAFAAGYAHSARTHRIELGADAVPRLLAVTYRDVGTCWYLPGDGTVRRNPSAWYLARRCLFALPGQRLRAHGVHRYYTALQEIVPCAASSPSPA